ncbi:hypothetical protein ACQ4LE_005621 [Meloidogyne hapla]
MSLFFSTFRLFQFIILLLILICTIFLEKQNSVEASCCGCCCCKPCCCGCTCVGPCQCCNPPLLIKLPRTCPCCCRCCCCCCRPCCCCGGGGGRKRRSTRFISFNPSNKLSDSSLTNKNIIDNLICNHEQHKIENNQRKIRAERLMNNSEIKSMKENLLKR